jgi:hypothetical protein
MPLRPQRHAARGSQSPGHVPAVACWSHNVHSKAQETFKFIGRGSSEANLKPDQLVILQQYKRSEEVSWGVGLGSLWLGRVCLSLSFVLSLSLFA